MTIYVLFARDDSVYKTLPGCDVFDYKRNALTYPGGAPVVAHPPCRAWGQLRYFARPVEGEKELALWAVEQVRRFGGVLEHPVRSQLWPVAGLPEPGDVDDCGGWTLVADQYWWGHRARKRTRFYIVGCAPRELPEMPIVLGEAPCTVGLYTGRNKLRCRPSITKHEYEHTPTALAIWLCEVARRCGKRSAIHRLDHAEI